MHGHVPTLAVSSPRSFPDLAATAAVRTYFATLIYGHSAILGASGALPRLGPEGRRGRKPCRLISTPSNKISVAADWVAAHCAVLLGSGPRQANRWTPLDLVRLDNQQDSIHRQGSLDPMSLARQFQGRSQIMSTLTSPDLPQC